MAHGFTVFNNNFQVLISNQTKTLHFVGKATLHSTVVSNNQCGGTRYWLFRIACTGVPVPFLSLPTTDFYAVLAVRSVSSGLWEIEILRSGTSTSLPEVYVFSDPNGLGYSGQESYGLKVFCDDGTLSFDSRLSPLVVTGGVEVVPPSSPINPVWYYRPYWSSKMEFTDHVYWYSYEHYRYFQDNYVGWRGYLIPPIPGDKGTGDPSSYLTPTEYNSYGLTSVAGNTKPIVFFPSLAQATRVAPGEHYPNSNYRCLTTYWTLYRGAIALTASGLQCGWVPSIRGNFWRAKAIDSGFSIGSGVDASSIVSAGAGGTPPYYNETLNLTPTTVIVANGTRYD